MIIINDVLITFAKDSRSNVGKEGFVQVTNGNNIEIFQWGSKNDLPNYREAMIMDNNIIGEMINTKRAIILGQGLQAHTVTYADGKKTITPVEMPPEIADWIEQAELYDKYIEPAANELFLHGTIFAAMMPRQGRIEKIMSYRCRYIRAETKKRNEPIAGYVLGDWPRKKSKGRNDTLVDYQYITAIPNPNREYIMQVGDNLFHDGYYPHPAYWGGEEWIDLSNQIPKFHKANILNGYTIRFHIEIPKDAFLDKTKYMHALSEGDNALINQCALDEENKKSDFINQMNTLLAGKENAGRTIYTYFDHDDMGKKIDGVKITPIEFDMKDEALLKLFDASNRANISSMGIHPTLANIETAGKMSSGSEMRNAFESYVKIKAHVPRNILLKPIHHVWKVNGWNLKYPDIKIGFEDNILTTLDDNKAGSEPITQATPS